MACSTGRPLDMEEYVDENVDAHPQGVHVKTIQMTIDEPLLAEVDRVAGEHRMTRSAFIREALAASLRRFKAKALEQKHRAAYARQPTTADELEIWQDEHAWGGRMNQGDVYWYALRSPDKRRPVLILTRDSAISYLSGITVAPITSTIRGIASEVHLTTDDGLYTDCAANLDNIRRS